MKQILVVMNNIKFEKYSKIFLIILGFIIFCVYILFRFIREILPKYLSFIGLSEFGLLRLLYICGIYFFIVFCFFNFSLKTQGQYFFDCVKILRKARIFQCI